MAILDLISTFPLWLRFFTRKLCANKIFPNSRAIQQSRVVLWSHTVCLIVENNNNANVVDCSWNVMAHGDAQEGKWRGNWRMEWAASTLHTISEHGVSSITTAYTHTSAASSRLNWRPRDLNGLVRFAERRNLVSARVPSHFNWPLIRYVTHRLYPGLIYMPGAILFSR
jgi:hypothetical protein